jgi:transposase-like protein
MCVFYENESKGMRLPSFTVSEKLRILQEAEEIGNHAAGRKYDVPKSCIRDWREKKEMLLKGSGTWRAFRGQKVRYPRIEEKLLEYVSQKRQFGYAVPTEMCQLKALALAKEQGIDGFKASRGLIMMFFFYKKRTLYKKKNQGFPAASGCI